MNPCEHAETASTAAVEERVPLTFAAHVRLSMLWFALNFQGAALLPIVIPTEIVLFVTPTMVGSAPQARFYGYLSAAGAVLAMLAPPLVGALSDHTRGPLGRRRPYIVVGCILILLGVFEMAAASDVGRFVLGFLLFELGYNAATAAYQGLIPDLVPEQQRGFASGLLGVMTLLGTVASLVLAGFLFGQVNLQTIAHSTEAAHTLIFSGSAQYYALTGFALVVVLLLTMLGVREFAPHAPATASATESTTEATRALARSSSPLPDSSSRPSLRSRFDAAWVEPFRHHNFLLVFLTRCFVFVGLTLFMDYIEYYFAQRGVGSFAQSTAILATLALLGAVVSSVVLGVLSDRVRRVPIVAVSSLCMAGSALAFVVVPHYDLLVPLGVVFGIGYGGYLSVDWALAVDALPSLASAGKDMGLWTIASNLPIVIAPLLGATVITLIEPLTNALFAYRLVFLVAGIFLLGGGVVVLGVREADFARSSKA